MGSNNGYVDSVRVNGTAEGSLKMVWVLLMGTIVYMCYTGNVFRT